MRRIIIPYTSFRENWHKQRDSVKSIGFWRDIPETVEKLVSVKVIHFLSEVEKTISQNCLSIALGGFYRNPIIRRSEGNFLLP